MIAGAEWESVLQASMGPRPDGRGKNALTGKYLTAEMRQWGRGQTAAESPNGPVRRPPNAGVNGAAARRPRKGGSGASRVMDAAASMGPRPDGRGKLRIATPMANRMLRQWGRGQTAAERP